MMIARPSLSYLRSRLIPALAFVAMAGSVALYADDSRIDLVPTTYRLILDPVQRTTLSAQVTTTIKEINKEMGEAFYEGETLIELDSVIVQAEYMKARAEMERALADLDAKQELFETNSVSLLDLREAEAGLAGAKADVTIAETRLEACVIIAPYDGKVVDLSFESHEMVQPGDELIEIVDDSILVAKFLVPSTELDRIAIGKTIAVHIHETQSQEEATIANISSVIDPASSTVKVEAEIDNASGHLRSGMIGKTTLAPAEEPDAATTSERD